MKTTTTKVLMVLTTIFFGALMSGATFFVLRRGLHQFGVDMNIRQFLGAFVILSFVGKFFKK